MKAIRLFHQTHLASRNDPTLFDDAPYEDIEKERLSLDEMKLMTFIQIEFFHMGVG